MRNLTRSWNAFVSRDMNVTEKEADLALYEMSRLMTKPTKWHVRRAKTQISLGIRPVWSESLLSAWRKLGSLATHWAQSEDSDQTGRMPRLIWVFAGRTCHFVGFVMRWLKFASKVAIFVLTQLILNRLLSVGIFTIGVAWKAILQLYNIIVNLLKMELCSFLKILRWSMRTFMFVLLLRTGQYS